MEDLGAERRVDLKVQVGLTQGTKLRKEGFITMQSQGMSEEERDQEKQGEQEDTDATGS